MVITKKEYSASDVQPALMYMKQNGDERIGYPVTAGMFNPKFAIPEYDRIDITYDADDNIETVTYGASGSTLAVIGITYSSGYIQTVVKL